MKLLSHFLNSAAETTSPVKNWKNHVIKGSLVFSHRDTYYKNTSFPSNLHYHDYYELIVIEKGEIKYVCEEKVYYPHPGDIILIPPGELHMSEITAKETHYVRNVFYFYPGSFSVMGFESLSEFLRVRKNEHLFSLTEAGEKYELFGLLHKLADFLSDENDPFSSPMSFSAVLQIFCFLNKKLLSPKATASNLPENIRKLKQYIDTNFAEIKSTVEIANSFFYSREYVSRLFRKHFDITISDYITKRRIIQAQKLLSNGKPITETAFGVGFCSLSSFVKAFRKETGVTPSVYRKMKKELD